MRTRAQDVNATANRDLASILEPRRLGRRLAHDPRGSGQAAHRWGVGESERGHQQRDRHRVG
jgi:hypothetical protein